MEINVTWLDLAASTQWPRICKLVPSPHSYKQYNKSLDCLVHTSEIHPLLTVAEKESEGKKWQEIKPQDKMASSAMSWNSTISVHREPERIAQD